MNRLIDGVHCLVESVMPRQELNRWRLVLSMASATYETTTRWRLVLALHDT